MLHCNCTLNLRDTSGTVGIGSVISFMHVCVCGQWQLTGLFHIALLTHNAVSDPGTTRRILIT